MPSLRNIDDLKRFCASARAARLHRAKSATVVSVGAGTCGIAAGARETMDFFRSELKRRGIPAEVCATGCIGVCVQEPLVDIQLPGMARMLYANVKPEMVAKLIEE